MSDMSDAHYLPLLRALLDRGSVVETRNSKCRRIFGHSCRFDRTPLVSARRTAWKNALREWEWFMSGSNDINDLHESARHWWRPWADRQGRLGQNYSVQFRRATADHGVTADQIALLIHGVKNHPFSRRNVIATWHPAEMWLGMTEPTTCHNTATQAFVEPDRSLHLVTYQRSADVVCGLPHNWIQEWAFLLWLAHRTGTTVGSLTWVGGDVHQYEAHADLAGRLVQVDPRASPELVYAPTSEAFRADDFSLSGEYEPASIEKAEMVV